MHAARGQREQALRWFKRAVVEAGWPYELTAIHDPMLASLRDDARFERLVDKMRKRNEVSRRRLEQMGNQDRGGWLQESGDLK